MKGMDRSRQNPGAKKGKRCVKVRMNARSPPSRPGPCCCIMTNNGHESSGPKHDGRVRF